MGLPSFSRQLCPVVNAALKACTAAELFYGCLGLEVASGTAHAVQVALQAEIYKPHLVAFEPFKLESVRGANGPIGSPNTIAVPPPCPRNSDMARSQRGYEAAEASQRKGPF
ncbi:hypothetical protein HaLaN_19704, partial [Haematococcus lacustris]